VYPFREMMGAINFICCAGRPDCQYANNQLCRYSNEPRVAHWDVAIDLVRYLLHTLHWGIMLGHEGYAIHKAHFKFYAPEDDTTGRMESFTRLPPKEVVGYADANHGTAMDDKKSVTGVVMHVYGGPVSWCSKVQSVASVSTTESEFRALSEASREALWLAKIVRLFDIRERPFLIRGDSKSAVASIKNHAYTRNTKHIEIHHDFMKDRYQSGDLDFEHIEGKFNPADIFTKALERRAFEACRFSLGMVDVARLRARDARLKGSSN
jgi:hypothetical protein